MKGRNALGYSVVRRIPRGYIADCGQVAFTAGLGALARQVGYAMHALPNESSVPWHRVVKCGERSAAAGCQVQNWNSASVSNWRG